MQSCRCLSYFFMKIIKPYIQIEDEITGDEILKKIEKIGRTCYKSEDKITTDSAAKFVEMLIKRGHEAMIEHVSISVRIICDRGISHELVRHRIASYAQESSRFCNYSKDKFNNEVTFIQPCWISENLTGDHQIVWDGLCGTCQAEPCGEDVGWWFWHMAVSERDYFKLLNKGWTPEEARSVLPNSLKTEIVATMNLREWRHFLKLRTDKAAHPQMREIANMILEEFKNKIPVVFDDIEGGNN